MRLLPDVTFTLKSQVPWIKDSPFESNFYNALSLILPEYERRLIEVCCTAKVPATGQLREDIIQFIRQEGSHSRVHSYYNKQLQSAGYRIDSALAITKIFAYFYVRKLPFGLRLGASAAGEHLTSMIAKYFIKHKLRYESTAQPGPYEVWYWHAIEELEHKAAMQDLMDNHNYGYITRLISYILINVWLVTPLVVYGILLLSWQDRSIFKARFWFNAAQFLFGKDGFAPIFIRLSLQYLDPSYHPLKNSDESSVEEYDALHRMVIDTRKIP